MAGPTLDPQERGPQRGSPPACRAAARAAAALQLLLLLLLLVSRAGAAAVGADPQPAPLRLHAGRAASRALLQWGAASAIAGGGGGGGGGAWAAGGRLYDQEQHLQRRQQEPQQQQQQQQQQEEQEDLQQQEQEQQRKEQRRVPIGAIAAMTLAMALASGLGAVPFFFLGSLPRPWAGLANAVASGVMLAASFALLHEGAPHGGAPLVGGMLLGAAFVKFSQQYLERYEVDSFEDLRGADARRIILFLAVMAAHAVGEGSGVGVSFSGERGWAAGTTCTLAIGLHNVPEGLAVATVLASRGASPRRLLLWTVLTALPQALVAVPSYLFVEAFAALLPLAMGFAAGCMCWIVVAELLPDALDALDGATVATAATAAAAWLQGLAIFIDHLERGGGGGGGGASALAGGPPLAPLAVSLLLPLLAPGIAAGMAANLLRSRPAALGLAGGALAGGGALSLLWLAALGRQGLAATALCGVCGAAAAALLGQDLMAGCVGGGVCRVPSALWDARKKDDCDAEAGHTPALQRNGDGGHADAVAHVRPYPLQHLQHLHHHHHHHQQQQQQYAPAHAAAPCGPIWAPPHEPSDVASPTHGRSWAMAVIVGDPATNGGGGGGGGGGSLARTLSGDAGSHPRLARASSGGGRPHAALLTFGLAGRVACVAMLGAALTCAAHGAALAGALLAAAGEGGGHFVVPMALHGALAGVACGGALVAAFGGGVRRVGALAALLCSGGPLVALALVVVGPSAYAGAAGSGALPAAAAAFSGGGEKLLAAAAGWSLHAGLSTAAPLARSWHARRAAAGVAAGAAIAVAGAGLAAALCAGTPYCLSPH
ncbi:zinc transporter [Raphidocelis subcapitata]|uniref:Zinc transporter n=1 Tax=Raphidocelis subcapitata TaxID=307507 RepID=A0A2V0P8W7_9CHLO|nr:zinc transporter [Raphidocelis subcapitata]|eukprot:GBF96009.1 zinc transporter [Raphidocelis subcapitata]